MEERFEMFMRGIASVYRSTQKIKSIEMTSFGLKGVHVLCLYFLYKHKDGLTSAQLSEMCGEDKAAISRAVLILKEKGLVTEAQPDGIKKYRSIITLTDAGKALAKTEAEKINNALDAGGKGLTDEERGKFYSSLFLIADNLEKYFKELEDGNK